MLRYVLNLILTIGLILSLGALPSRAEIVEVITARTALFSGDYEKAQELGLASQSVDGYILAAEALSAQVMLQEVSNTNRSARIAKGYAQKALDLDPNNSEALIQYALALGFETRSASIMRAWMGKMPEKSKAAIERAAKASPNDARTKGLRGAWHLGIVTKVGDENASKWFEATTAQGLAGYEAALQLKPDDTVILANYALSLMLLDPVAHKDKAKTLLLAMEAAPLRTEFDRAIKARMGALLPILDDPDAVMKAAQTLAD